MRNKQEVPQAKTFNVGDRVKCNRDNYEPYTGTVSEVFTHFVKVMFDKPQGPGGMHTFSLTSPLNLDPESPEEIHQYAMPQMEEKLPEDVPVVVKPLDCMGWGGPTQSEAEDLSQQDEADPLVNGEDHED